MNQGHFTHQVHLELIKLLFKQIKFALWAESFAAIGFAFALWGALDPYLLLSWLMFNLLLCGLARHVMVYFYRQSLIHHELDEKKAHFWLFLFSIGAFISGLSWGAVGSILMVDDTVRQTFEVFLLIGVTAAANPFYSPYKHVYVLFLLPAFVPFAVWLMVQGGIFIILGTLAIIYIVIMLAISFYSHQLLAYSLRLRFENMDLVDHLSNAKNALEKRSNDLEKSLSLLYHQAHYDPLTELPNRILVADRIAQAIAYAKRSNTSIAILFIDIDQFKMINDTVGHRAGDKLLKAVAERLKMCVRGHDTVSRLGGDEFIIILTLLKHETAAGTTAKSLMRAFKEVFLIGTHKFNITISIGISLYPKDGENVELLIKNADIAMYRAKEVGRNTFQYYTEALNRQIQKRSRMENDLRSALAHDELTLLYQPIVGLKTGRIVGVEALLRWIHPHYGLISPVEFVYIAEESGMMDSIGEWVLRMGCNQVKYWQSQGVIDLYVAINLSARQFKQVNLYDQIKLVLQETKLAPASLELELTESVMMKESAKNIVILDKLKKLGTSIAIDDFGMRYSSLNSLKQLPIDKLKIDISFIKDIEKQMDGAAISAAIIALAAKLNLQVAAEGVENENQLKFLIEHHCDEMQGFYFSKPLSAQACSEFLYSHPVLTFPVAFQAE